LGFALAMGESGCQFCCCTDMCLCALLGPIVAVLTHCADVAAMAVRCRNDPVGVRTCKQLLLEQLACPQLPGCKLADAWVPATRIRSAVMQALQ
jgi:hypothetical protein